MCSSRRVEASASGDGPVGLLRRHRALILRRAPGRPTRARVKEGARAPRTFGRSVLSLVVPLLTVPAALAPPAHGLKASPLSERIPCETLVRCIFCRAHVWVDGDRGWGFGGVRPSRVHLDPWAILALLLPLVGQGREGSRDQFQAYWGLVVYLGRRSWAGCQGAPAVLGR